MHEDVAIDTAERRQELVLAALQGGALQPLFGQQDPKSWRNDSPLNSNDLIHALQDLQHWIATGESRADAWVAAVREKQEEEKAIKREKAREYRLKRLERKAS